jgi:hypothetical protein
MDLRAADWSDIDLKDLTQGRDQWRALEKTATNIRVP